MAILVGLRPEQGLGDWALGFWQLHNPSSSISVCSLINFPALEEGDTEEFHSSSALVALSESKPSSPPEW